jgi:hypothetical protein
MECSNYEIPQLRRGIVKGIMIFLSVVSIVVVVLAIIFLPRIIDYYQDQTGKVLAYSYVIFMWITSVPLLVMLIHFLRISIQLGKNAIFSPKVQRSLSSIQVCLALEVILYVWEAIDTRQIIAVIVLFGCLILFVLATLFREIIKEGEVYYTDSMLSI